MFELEVSPIVGSSASFIFSNNSGSTLGLGIFVILPSGALGSCCFDLLILGLVIPNGLFGVCGTFVLVVDDAFFMLSLGSILLSGDRGLRSMFRFIVGLFLWSRSLMLVILIDDLLSDFLFDSCIYCWRPLFSLCGRLYT